MFLWESINIQKRLGAHFTTGLLSKFQVWPDHLCISLYISLLILQEVLTGHQTSYKEGKKLGFVCKCSRLSIFF